MLKKLFILLGLISSAHTMAEDITTYTPGADEGIVYFLPKTAIEVSLIVTRTEYKPGAFYQFANRYLRLDDVKSKAYTSWSLKAIETRPIGIVDSTKAYIMKLKDRNPLSNIELTEDGIIRAINAQPTKMEQEKVHHLTKPESHENGRNYLTEEILLAGSTAKMAELTAKEIYNIRESKNLIMRGQADAMPKDGASLKIVLDGLSKQEKALTELFAGIVDHEDMVVKAIVIPDENPEKKVAMRFSNQLGVLDKDDLAGKPIYVSTQSFTPIAPAEEEGTKEEEVKEKKEKLGGVIYNVPGKGKVTVSYEGKNLIEQEYPITQYGYTETLTYKLFSKKNNVSVVFNPATGALISIDSGSRE